MNYKLLLETVRHLRPRQIFYQLLYRVYKPILRQCKSPIDVVGTRMTTWIDKPRCLSGQTCEFLNISDNFTSWNMTQHGMLWAYNLNYMDFLLQADMTEDAGVCWIDNFIDNISSNRVGLAPYPIALRSINWAKFFILHPDSATSKRLDSLYSQVCLLEQKLEYHLLGNHLLEDAFALFFTSVFFANQRLFAKASKLLLQQLDEQILDDGMHYEQSPMYHSIMLDRLLDCYNISVNNLFAANQDVVNEKLKEKATLMLGFLEQIKNADGTLPLLNDSAEGIAPVPVELMAYAQRLGLSSRVVPMGASGYRRMRSEAVDVIVDVGNLTASYQPGHSHADTFNYELRLNNKLLVVDTGISTYDKTARRQYERSTAAHNTVSVGGMDSSHVWGGFRVGKRAKVNILSETPGNIVAEHDGFGKSCLHQRSFSVDDTSFTVEDKLSADTDAVSYIHVCPGVNIRQEGNDFRLDNYKLLVSGADSVHVVKNTISTEYNRFEDADVLEIRFRHHVKYTFVI